MRTVSWGTALVGLGGGTPLSLIFLALRVCFVPADIETKDSRTDGCLDRFGPTGSSLLRSSLAVGRVPKRDKALELGLMLISLTGATPTAASGTNAMLSAGETRVSKEKLLESSGVLPLPAPTDESREENPELANDSSSCRCTVASGSVRN